jgi:hypothetical protein
VHQRGRVKTIRLACTNAPPLDQPLGMRSRDYLRSLLAQANNHVILTIADTDRQGRKVAEVNVPTLNSEEEELVQYEMVAAGWAYPYEKFSDHCPNWDVVQQGGYSKGLRKRSKVIRGFGQLLQQSNLEAIAHSRNYLAGSGAHVLLIKSLASISLQKYGKCYGLCVLREE